MSWVNKLATSVLGFATAAAAMGAEPAAAEAGVNPRAHALFHIGPLPVSNSMVTSWVVAIVVILAIRFAVGRAKLRPSGGQVVVESLVEGVLDLTSPIVGKKVAKVTFPLLVGLFTFILMQNWAGLVPGVGTVMMRDAATGRWDDFVRPGNADLNLTFALAAVAFGAWLYLHYQIRRAQGHFSGSLRQQGRTQNDVSPCRYYLFLYVVFLRGRHHRDRLDHLPARFHSSPSVSSATSSAAKT